MRTFEIGDRIIYRTKGVCTVVDVVKKAFSGYEEKEYYVVESVSADHYRSYVPVDSPTASLIKLVPSVAEVDEMIERSTRLCPEYETDKKKRESDYAAAQKRDDEVELLAIYAMLYKRKQTLPKIPAADLKMMAYIERIINEEFAFCLGIARDEVGDYIRKKSL